MSRTELFPFWKQLKKLLILTKKMPKKYYDIHVKKQTEDQFKIIREAFSFIPKKHFAKRIITYNDYTWDELMDNARRVREKLVKIMGEYKVKNIGGFKNKQ